MIPSSPKIDEILNQLTESVDEIEAAVVVGIDGLPISAKMAGEFDATLLSAMSAALLNIGERAASDLEKGVLHQVFAQGETGSIIMVSAGPDSVLMVSTNTASLSGLGLVFIEMEKAAQKIAKHLTK
jgi:predicted regulator of Ras-like GTPase activity (Roadblock/LC7/MglB family)